MEDFLTPLLTKKSMLICCGSGGVGKTTTAAVLGLRAAVLGRKTLVLTIDPAKRLANALGLEELGNTIRQINPREFEKAGLQVKGELHAMMLDCKRTFDDMVYRYASNKELAENILKNNYYQNISNAMTGSHEYMAMEKLYDIRQSKKFDIIILDTPPTHNALDFLDAPGRITNFFDDSVIKWFLKPYFLAGKFSFKTAKRGSKIVFRILEKVTGLQVLKDLSEFFLSFSGMYSGFKERAEKVRSLLKDPSNSFILVTSPNALTVEECIFFYQKLKESQMPIGGILVNKVHPLALEEGYDQHEILTRAGDFAPSELLNKMAENLIHFQALHDLDCKAIGNLMEKTQISNDQLKCVRYFDEDIYALEDLKMMLGEIFPQKNSEPAKELAALS